MSFISFAEEHRREKFKKAYKAGKIPYRKPSKAGTRITLGKSARETLISELHQGDSTKVLELKYRTDASKLLSGKRPQERFKNRLCVIPEIEILEQFKCKAEIDFIELVLDVKYGLDWRSVRKKFGQLVNPAPYTTSIASKRLSENKYRVRLQEPSISAIKSFINDYEVAHSSISPAAMMSEIGISNVSISELEVSVDFYPKFGGKEARRKMLGLLARHYFPPDRMMDTKAQAIRVYANNSTQRLDQIFPSLTARKPAIVKPKIANHLYVDGTVYVGNKNDDCKIRMMEKITDKRNPKTKRFEYLPENKCRTRIEVTLKNSELNKLGILSLDNLIDFNFAKLRGEFFDFRLPTISKLVFSDGFVEWDMCKQEAALLEAFLNMGIANYRREQQRAHNIHRANEYAAKRKGIKRRIDVKRVALGRNSNMIVYEDLHSMIDEALRNLSKRKK